MPPSIPVLVAAFAAFAAASPLTLPPTPRLGFAFSTNLTASRSEEDVNPALSLAWPYAKYNVPMPPVVRAAALKQTALIRAATVSTSKKDSALTGTATTSPEAFDVEYLVPVNVNGLNMNLVLDSGSSDFWVYSDLLPTSNQAGHSVYKTTKAKEQVGESYYIKYGDGSHSEGKVYRDTVAVAGIQVANYPVEAASVVSQSWLNHVDADGLLGLSMSSLNSARPTQVMTFFDHIKSNLAKAVYTVTLKKGATGSLDFGYVDRSKFRGSLGYIDVYPADAQFWQFRMQRFAIAGKDFPKITPFITIVDTGTSLTYLPDAIVKPFYARIAGAAFNDAWAGWTFPCNTFIPWIGLYINGIKYSMSPPMTNWARINATHCLGGIQSSGSLPFSILGATFLKRHYVIFDAQFKTPRIGFGVQNDA